MMERLVSIDQSINKTKEELFFEKKLKDIAKKIDKKYPNGEFAKIFNKKFEKIFSDNKITKEEFEQLKDWLEQIKNDLIIIKSYKIESSIDGEFKKILTQKYKNEMNLLKKEILEQPDIRQNFLKNTMKAIYDSIGKNTQSFFSVTLDKNWSFDDTKIGIINTKNTNNKIYGIMGNSFFIYENSKLSGKSYKKINIQKENNNAKIELIGNNKIEIIYIVNNRVNKLVFDKKSYENRFKLMYHQNHIVNSFLNFSVNNFWSIKRQFEEDKKIFEKLGLKNRQKTETKIHKNKEVNHPKIRNNESKTKHKEKISSVYLENKKLSKLPANERMKIIENYLNSPEMKPYYDYVLNQLEGETITLSNGKKITYTKKYIKENYKNLVENLKTAVLFFVYIESVGDPLAKNLEGSSARGIGQWLLGNGGDGTEYLVNGKFYTKKEFTKLGFHNYSLERKYYKTNSWETTLNYIWLSFDKKISNKIRKDIKWFPENKITKPTHQNPINISWKDQIKILTLSFGAKKNHNLIKYTGTLLQGNIWAIKKIYILFHNTAPDKKTLERIREAEKKYYNRLIKYALNNYKKKGHYQKKTI